VKIQLNETSFYSAVVLAMLVFLTPSLLAQGVSGKQTGSASKTKTPSTPSVTATPSDAIHDVMTVTFESSDVCSVLYKDDKIDWSAKVEELGNETQLIKENKSFIKPLHPWPASPLSSLIAAQCSECAAASNDASGKTKSDTAYVFHLTEWEWVNKSRVATPSYVPVSSDWHVYEQNGPNTLRFTGFTSDGNPRIFNKKNVIVVGIDHFSTPIDLNTFGSMYNTVATQGTPQNQTDLAALISALAGISSPLKAASDTDKPTACPLFLAAGIQHGTARLPFDTKVTVTSGNPSDIAKSAANQSDDASDGETPSQSKPLQTNEIKTASTSCSPPTDCADLRLLGNPKSVKVSVSGTFSGSLVFEVGKDGTYTTADAAASDKGGAVQKVTAPGTWTVQTEGQEDVRVRAESWNSGTANVSFSNELSAAPKSTHTAGGGNNPNGKTPTEPAPGVMACTGTRNSAPCTATRTFTSEDPEWWDVSIGIAIPGIRESKYSIVNGDLTKSVTTHTDFYGMLDLYPFFLKTDKNDWAPHFNVGVPITSQSFYRPYFGLAESVGGVLSRIAGTKKPFQLPVNINVFAGMVWMKTTYVSDNPTTNSDLTSDSHATRVWKPIFGIEVPVSSIASKIKGAGSKNTNGSGKSSGSGATGS